MAKPREFAHLIRNRFGSADNISNIRPVEGTPNPATADEIFIANSTANIGLSAGNSNSLPGHGTQVGWQLSCRYMIILNDRLIAYEFLITNFLNIQPAVVSTAVVPAASQGSGGGKYTSEEGSECGSSVTSESIPGGLHMSPRHNTASAHSGLESFFQELQERREEVDRLREEMEHVKV